jgi:hypothetical protein
MIVQLTRTVRGIAALLLVCACGAVAAQQAQTTRLIVEIVQLKPDMQDEWRAMQQNEVNPALKKQGITTRTVLETLFGDRPEYVTIRPLPSFAELDGTGLLQQALGERAADALIARLQATAVANVRFIVNRQDEFTLGNTSAPIRVTNYYQINPGAGDAYREFLRDQVIPLNRRALESGRIAGYSVSVFALGSPVPGLWSQTTYLPNAAALDAQQGVAPQILGEAGAALLAARARELRTNYRVVVRRRIPELSY